MSTAARSHHYLTLSGAFLTCEHILHRVKSGRFSQQEPRCVERTAGETVAILRPMGKLEDLAGQGEDYGMLARRIRDAQ